MQAVARHCRDIVHFSAREKQWQGCKHKSCIRWSILCESQSCSSVQTRWTWRVGTATGRRPHQWLFRNSGGMTAKLKLSGSGDGEKLIRIRNAEHVGFENQRVGSAAGAAGSGSRVGRVCGWVWQWGRQWVLLSLAFPAPAASSILCHLLVWEKKWRGTNLRGKGERGLGFQRHVAYK